MRKQVEKLAAHLNEHARSELDNEAAKALYSLLRVYEAAREIVMARTHEHSKAAYSELVDIFRGKPDV